MKYSVDIPYSLNELKEMYNKYFDFPVNHKVTKEMILYWFANMIRTGMESASS